MPLPIHRPISRRHLLIALAAGALVAPLGALAQQPGKVRRIGFLAVRSPSTPSNPDAHYDAFMEGMRELGHVDGKNLLIEWRFADGKYERLPSLAAELVQMKVELIATHGTPLTKAAQGATRTIPIVTAAAADPVGSGFAASLARPGGNITGLSVITVDLSPKHVELLKTMKPGLTRVAVVVNPGNTAHPVVLMSVQAAARQVGIRVLPVEASTPGKIERGFTVMSMEHVDAVIVAADAFFIGQGQLIADLALKNRILLMSPYREIVAAGGLMSYGQNIADHFRRAATYVDKILKGAKPGELPIEQPTTIHPAINRKTAKALGITIPQELLIRADEVIE